MKNMDIVKEVVTGIALLVLCIAAAYYAIPAPM